MPKCGLAARFAKSDEARETQWLQGEFQKLFTESFCKGDIPPPLYDINFSSKKVYGFGGYSPFTDRGPNNILLQAAKVNGFSFTD